MRYKHDLYPFQVSAARSMITSSPGRIIRSEKFLQLGHAFGPDETITSSTSSIPGIEYSFSNPKAATSFSVSPGLMKLVIS